MSNTQQILRDAARVARRRPRLPGGSAGLLVILLALLSGACQPSPADPDPEVEPLPPRSNIVLITIDTLRADHVSSYGYPRQTTPMIDRLAASGVRFDQASSQWPKTTPSFASMFTASYAKDNGNVRKIGIPLQCRFETLAEVLQRQGYGTHAVVANAAVGSELNFDQGFDTFIETWKLTRGDHPVDANSAAAVTRIATAELSRIDRRRPFFLWVHYLDPHWPYTPPPGWQDRFQNDRWFDRSQRIPIAKGKQVQEMMGIGEGQQVAGRDDLAFYVARYDAKVAYADFEVGKLLAALRQRGLLDKTLIALTADHGESLGDHHYYFDHGRFGYQTCLRVPLILSYPGVIAPRVDADPVELLDLAPTLIEATGVPLAGGAWMQGHSLTPRLRGHREPRAAKPAGASSPSTPADGPGHPGYAFSEAGYELDNQWEKIVRDDRFKLIYAQRFADQRWLAGAGEGVQFVLYDLQNDPGETRNVAALFPDDLRRLKITLWKWMQAPHFEVATEPPGEECTDQRPLDPRSEQLLRSLGYLR
jgi:arylsulfatase A-like enzyme